MAKPPKASSRRRCDSRCRVAAQPNLRLLAELAQQRLDELGLHSSGAECQQFCLATRLRNSGLSS
eukprot:3557667-Heterocapsa_arctica.AAC.1